MATFGYPSICANSKGTVAFAYPSFIGGLMQIYVRISTDNGDTWALPVKVTDLTYDCKNPSIDVDDYGNIVVAFETIEEGLVRQIYRVYKYFDSSTWSDAERVSSVTIAYSSAGNYVLNGTFEAWAVTPTAWSNSGCTAAQESTIVKSGTYSMKLTASDNANYMYQSVDISSNSVGDKFAIQVNMRAASGSANIELVIDEGKSKVLTTEVLNQWVTKTIVVEKRDANAGTIEIRLYGTGTADTVYFDGVYLYTLSPKSFDQTNPNLVVDRNFKRGHANILYSKNDVPLSEIRVMSAGDATGGVDVSDDVESLRISRDKEFKTGIFGAGDFTLVLDNSSGAYNNESESSPFYQRLKSGIEVEIELGIREYTGSTSPRFTSNWSSEMFPSMIGVASKFSVDSLRESITLSGRDRADKFMSYRNFSSALYESKQAIELITELANPDVDGDGVGDYDENRPSIDISLDADQQTLTTWDEGLLSSVTGSSGDAGANALTNTVIGEADFNSESLGTILHAAWIERGSTNYLWLITELAGSPSTITLSKWSGYASGSLVLEANYNISTDVGVDAANKTVDLTASPYDEDNDCVWLLRTVRDATGSPVVKTQYIDHLDFKTQTLTNKITVHSINSPGDDDLKPGFICYDPTNTKLFFSSTWDVSSSNFMRYGSYSVALPALTLTLDGVATIYYVGGFDHQKNFPIAALCIGDYFYIGKGVCYESTTPPNPHTAYTSFGAMHYDELSALSNNFFDSFWYTDCNSAVCFVDYLTTSGYATGESFFNSTSAQEAIKSFDYDENFAYIFCGSGDSTNDYGGKITTNTVQIRKLATRKRTLVRTNVVGSNHTTANGYEENDIDYIWFSSEELKVENVTLSSGAAAEYHADEYSAGGLWTLTGDPDITSGFPSIPADDYNINLETGDVLLKHLFDKNNKLTASYDYKYAVPYAWFEDTSIWDAIQEVASAGDFVCYVDESGELVFKDRFRHYYPVLSDYSTSLQSDGGWDTLPADVYDLTDSAGANITNIIPGLEFVLSFEPDKTTGKFKTYKRRSYVTNGTAYISTVGDYDINYDTGEIAWSSSGDIKSGERVHIYFYNRDYIYNFRYDSNIYNLQYSWGSDSLANRVTVKGERYFPSQSPISVREVYAVSPGDKVVNTGFSTIKQLEVGTGATDLTQNQYDDYTRTWKAQSGTPIIDIEFRNKLIGDTTKSREAGTAARIRVIPCSAPGDWEASATSAETIPDSAWVGKGYKINWDSIGDTGEIAMPTTAEPKLNIKSVELLANGLRIEVDHLDRDQRQYYIQVELEGYTLTRTLKLTALHEDLASIEKYYTKSYELSNRFITDMPAAKDRARRLVHYLSEERPEVVIEVMGNPTIELEDIVTVTDINSGLAGDYFEVNGISDTIVQDSYTTTLLLRKICSVSVSNLVFGNAISGYGGGYIGKAPLPVETFIIKDYNAK